MESSAEALRRVLRSEALEGADLKRATEELTRLDRATRLAQEAAQRLGKTPAQMLKDFPRVEGVPAATTGGGLLAAVVGAARAATTVLSTPFLLLLPAPLLEASHEEPHDHLA